MSVPVVEISRLSKRFTVRHERLPSVKRLFTRLLKPFPSEALWALREVSLCVTPGESLGIIGSNGSGKSTLLRLVAGILTPTEGEVVVRGRAGGLFELAAGFNLELNGWDNIRLSGALMGYARGPVEEHADEIADFSELREFLDVPVKSYSSGMALRLGFAIAVAFEPEVLLVDEVMAVADEHFQRKAYRRLRELEQQGSAVIMVSHEMAAIEGSCPRVIWMHRGEVLADGPAHEVVQQYMARESEANGA